MRSLFLVPVVLLAPMLTSLTTAEAADAGGDKVTLKGTVTLPDGKPATGAEVGLMEAGAEPVRQSRPIARTQTNAAGEFTFEDVKPGAYRVVARTDAGRGMTSATVKAGETASVKVALEDPGRARNNPPGRTPQRDGEFNTRPATGERYETRLKVGDAATDFTLASPDEKTEVTLSSFKGRKPVVLVFGSFTCPPFRDRVVTIDKMYDTYKDRAEFLMVYTREAHPDSVIRVMEDGRETLKKIEQTDDLAARNHNATLCTTTLKLRFPAVVDKEDNKVNAAYAGWPSRLIVVGADGKVAYDGGQGPGGFQPAELQKWLDANLPSK